MNSENSGNQIAKGEEHRHIDKKNKGNNLYQNS